MRDFVARFGPLRGLFQNQVFLEDRDCARGMLKNQAFACDAAGGVLEGRGFDAVAALFATVSYFGLRVNRSQSVARSGERLPTNLLDRL